MPLNIDVERLLPYYANLREASLVNSFTASVANTAPFDYKPADGSVEIATQVFCQNATSATVGTRVTALSIKDQDGHLIAQVVSPAQPGASSGANMLWSTDVAGSFVDTTGVYALSPLPVIVLLPGYKLRIEMLVDFAGDHLANVSVYVFRVPTGPQGGASTPILPQVL